MSWAPHTTTYACYKQAYRMPITLLEAVTSHLFVSAFIWQIHYEFRLNFHSLLGPHTLSPTHSTHSKPFLHQLFSTQTHPHPYRPLLVILPTTLSTLQSMSFEEAIRIYSLETPTFILTVHSISHKTHPFTSDDPMTRPSLIATPLQIKVTISSCSELPAFRKYIW
ncbi:hypothetical protein CROQUDRAFT_504104 [Cronartium quercuum f. sp. fusiforme G11]|uniref:Uncharacterized protein n=1 Tax=Cronartium quercuum f. sp. fusiforme G11 TaxID=708437 RepID=A0A9P6TGZ8_9BASI|nr:hypothetical protein CROQUDRAFT_504104 [Cronartium quercuum f. sp. fusiforme G11]